MITAACIASASHAYGIPRASIMHVLRMPASVGGIGQMHIPATWLTVLAKVGFAPPRVTHDRCTNIEAGAWIMAFDRMRTRLRTSAPAAAPAPFLPSAATQNDRGAAVSASCIQGAARFYHLPVALFSAVLRTEGGTVGQSYRPGPSGFGTAHRFWGG